MFRWYTDIDWKIRMAIELLIIVLSILSIPYWPGSLHTLAIGIFLLLFTDPDRSEKNGYHF
ncbi:MAG: hypothetical protein HRT89_22815 [Lentisphaeria bacterium]|nr:hypothetical protein [Lentisphaeria bacterium]NQZ70893.1 hypothetical protein [Lentisphaeria bacterium]